MSTLNEILADKKEWKKNFDAMPITGNCDSKCGKLATQWFGNTSCATCGDEKCVAVMQAEYDANIARDPEEDERW